MKACIVFAHAGENSFNHEILNRVKESCDKSGITYNVRDLYKMKFKAVFDAVDMHNVETKQVTTDVEEEQQVLTDADLLVMIYPIWWWSQPAILKGYIDRVFTDKFAFEYGPNGPSGLLHGKQAIVFTTSRESTNEMQSRGLDQVIKKQIVDGTLTFVGFENVQHKNFAEVPYVSDTEWSQMLRDVEAAIAGLKIPAGI